jgi:YidC/Oxa1 family membrane protein insertase
VEFGADGAVRSWELEYRGAKPFVVGTEVGPLAVGISRAGVEGVEVVALQPGQSELVVGGRDGPGTLGFTGTTTDGLHVRKQLEFHADAFEIGARVTVDGPVAPGTRVLLYWTSPVMVPAVKPGDPVVTFGETPDHRQLLGRILVGRPGREPEVFDAPGPALREPREAPGPPQLKDPHPITPEVVSGGVTWIALENDYFIAALTAGNGVEGLRGRTRELAEGAVVFPEVTSGGRWEGLTRLYVGPKQWKRLAALGVGLEAAQGLNYGHFLRLPFIPMWWFCVPLLWLLNFFGTHVPGQNYGVAIILLTVLVKAAFYPLAQKSMRSMKQMQALQPQLNALKAKYRSDAQRFQREQMELFRKHRVNPMGGCLPMVVQIPIFYALYLTLQYSVELQGAPFVLWIHDLSRKDPYYVLPILMGVSMLVQQKMTPTVGDPRQAQIMLVMPVVFTFMFLEFPTGLVLYWLVNNVLSILQQYLIDRATARSAAGSG